MSQENAVDDVPVVRIDRGLLETWPGRFRFPDVLIRLVAELEPNRPAEEMLDWPHQYHHN